MIFTVGGVVLPILLTAAAIYVGSQEMRVVRRKTGDNSWLMKVLSLQFRAEPRAQHDRASAEM